MTTSPDLLVAPAAPEPTGSGADRPDGFLDCRGHWHSWVDEEND